MAHIHLGEGSFPLWALALWTLVGIGLISIVVYRVRKGGIKTHQIALAGIAAAASFAIFQLNIPVWGGIHMNLTGLVGILAGPILGTLIALVVNVFSAALGHGAVGLLGANTLVNATEAIVAYYGFKTLMRSGVGRLPRECERRDNRPLVGGRTNGRDHRHQRRER